MTCTDLLRFLSKPAKYVLRSDYPAVPVSFAS